MKLKISLIATVISAVLCVPAVAEDNGAFHKKLYIGAGGGASRLDPEVQSGVNLDVTDRNSTGQKVYVGWDFTPRLAVELGVADLGEAEIGNIGGGPAGEIDYEVADLSLLYHFFNIGGWDRLLARQGFGAFWKVGVGTMDNDSNLPFTRENDTHLMGGIGVEYGTKVGLALRGEFEAFDEDALLGSVSLLWRLGGPSGLGHGGLFSKGKPQVNNNVVAAPVVADGDGDGIPNDLDDCPNSAAGEPVNATGCAIFDGVVEGVRFESGSDKLTEDAQVILNDAADALLNHPDTTVEVQAHTDSQGDADYNLDLSKQRALSTVRYLMLRGVPSEQLLARAFGESKPIEENDTPEGRAANRRVEFHVTK